MLVGASEFGGPNDPGTGHVGYKGDDLRGKMCYAELLMGTALGNLPYGTKAKLTYNGRSVIAAKLDIGAGGAPVEGHTRALDLWYETANALGFNGLGTVDFQVVDSSNPTTVSGSLNAVLNQTSNPLGGFGDKINNLLDVGTWYRVGLIIAGAIGIIIGTVMLAKGTSVYQATASTIGKVTDR